MRPHEGNSTMRRIRQLALAAAIGLFSAGVASAQGTPQPLPAAPGGAPAVQPKAVAPTQPPPTHFGAATAAPTTLGSTGCAGGTVGCAAPCATDCGPTCGKSLFGKLGHSKVGKVAAVPLIGPGCASPIGCSNFAAERTFIFGSCRQFFNPGNKCGLRGGCSVGGIGGCHGSSDPCVYGSYLNR